MARAAAACLLAMSAASAAAQAYPHKPIRLVVPFPPGGPTDLLARAVAQRLSEQLGQPVNVDNKPGASGLIGAELVARAAADGHTLLANASIHVINPSLYKKMPFDAAHDFVPVSQIADVPLVLVTHPDLPARTVQELIELARGKPAGLLFASSGNASAPHLAGEAFRIATGVTLAHVPYKGSGPALTDLIGGQVQLMFDSLPSSMGYINAGRIRPIAVTTAQRSTALPKVPTVAESGLPGFDISTWYGIWAPAGTPREITDRLGAEIAQAVRSPEGRARLLALGAEPVGSTPEAFAAYNRAETAKWARIVKDSGAQVD